jgi:hypothetical protein
MAIYLGRHFFYHYTAEFSFKLGSSVQKGFNDLFIFQLYNLKANLIMP